MIEDNIIYMLICLGITIFLIPKLKKIHIDYGIWLTQYPSNKKAAAREAAEELKKLKAEIIRLRTEEEYINTSNKKAAEELKKLKAEIIRLRIEEEDLNNPFSRRNTCDIGGEYKYQV